MKNKEQKTQQKNETKRKDKHTHAPIVHTQCLVDATSELFVFIRGGF